MIHPRLKENITDFFQIHFDKKPSHIEIQNTKKEFDGDQTIVLFPFLKWTKRTTEELGRALGDFLIDKMEDVVSFNVVKGFLNIRFSNAYFAEVLIDFSVDSEFNSSDSIQKTMVEYSSPNTNKPIHLGHIRNILLGHSISKIIEKTGTRVIRSQIINDRGIHICKSMVAWMKFGKDQTPEQAKIKGDHFVGRFYVKFNDTYSKEVEQLIGRGMAKEEAEGQAPILVEARKVLKQWEEGIPNILSLWKTMNGWVYEGFETTYQRLGVSFDAVQYESETYLLGKEMIDEGLEKRIFYRKGDGSVWIDLSDEGLDEKLVLRADGTSVYTTQDLGTARERFLKFDLDQLIYTVGNEQDHHFKVLFLILKKMGYTWADNMHHLSYGMVDLPEGKMKSREGALVDADDLIDEMVETAKNISTEMGKLEGCSELEKEKLYEIIGLGALKYFILKVDPKKRILFNPKKSVDFNGNTASFIQYAYTRIQSLLRKGDKWVHASSFNAYNFLEEEKNIINHLSQYQDTIQKAADQLNPGIIANYAYDLVKLFNHFYQNISILGSTSDLEKAVRLRLSKNTGEAIESCFDLLGIEVPSRM